jgi:hypothetical protein
MPAYQVELGERLGVAGFSLLHLPHAVDVNCNYMVISTKILVRRIAESHPGARYQRISDSSYQFVCGCCVYHKFTCIDY